jgi:hypothetical protein
MADQRADALGKRLLVQKPKSLAELCRVINLAQTALGGAVLNRVIKEGFALL